MGKQQQQRGKSDTAMRKGVDASVSGMTLFI